MAAATGGLRDVLAVVPCHGGGLRIQGGQDQADGGRGAIVGNCEMQARVPGIQILQTSFPVLRSPTRSAGRLAAYTIAYLDFEDAISLSCRYFDPSPFGARRKRRVRRSHFSTKGWRIICGTKSP